METRTGFFDTRAENWEETCYPPAVRERLGGLIHEFGIMPGERLLDVGTGPGVLLPYLRQCVGPSGQISALDLSYEMIRQAYRKPRLSLDLILQADVHYLPFGSMLFDRVICFAAFPHFIDPGQALQEMSRVLKIGGGLVIAHLMSREELSMHHASQTSVARDLLPEDPQMDTLFREAGLSSPEIVDIPGRYVAKGLRRIR